jgi:hypothetical protein
MCSKVMLQTPAIAVDTAKIAAHAAQRLVVLTFLGLALRVGDAVDEHEAAVGVDSGLHGVMPWRQ